MRIYVNNYTKLSYLLLCSMLVSSNLPALDLPFSPKTIAGLVGLGTIFTFGNSATEKNQEYTENNKKPDLELAIRKLAGGIATLAFADYFMSGSGKSGEGLNDIKNLVVKGILVGACTLSSSDTVGNQARKIPVLGGFLSDPKDKKDGREQKGMGALLRFLIPYVALKEAAIKSGFIVKLVPKTK